MLLTSKILRYYYFIGSFSLLMLRYQLHVPLKAGDGVLFFHPPNQLHLLPQLTHIDRLVVLWVALLRIMLTQFPLIVVLEFIELSDHLLEQENELFDESLLLDLLQFLLL